VADPSSTDGLHPLLLDPTRLKIAAALRGTGEVDFGFVRDRVGLTDSALSKQLRTMGDADLVTLRRERTGPRRRAWIRLTPNGRTILEQHATALTSIVLNDN
jgi:DNA-binding transcriptional ArsR family regulator